MDDEVNILQKADALLGKHRPSPTMDFPVLTEVVEPPIIIRYPATPREQEPAENGVVASIPLIDANALEDRVLARALTSSNAILSNWTNSSLHQELLFLIQSSIDKLEQDVATMLTEKVSAHVRASVQNALESELFEIRHGENQDKRS